MRKFAVTFSRFYLGAEGMCGIFARAVPTGPAQNARQPGLSSGQRRRHPHYPRPLDPLRTSPTAASRLKCHRS